MEGGETRARQPGERILSDQGSQTEVHLIIVCADSVGHPSRDGVLLIVGVQVFRLGLFIYPSLTPGGHNHSYLWLKMKYIIFNFTLIKCLILIFTSDNAYLYAGMHPLP